jgi:Rha family phage regulatory protein
MIIDSQDLTVFIAKQGDELVTDSRAVAVAFGKKHKDVLRVIDRMRLSSRQIIAAHAERSFAPSSYVDVSGRSLPLYQMTAKGLSELAMGFNGDDAREVRIRFLNAFDVVSQRLVSAERSLIELLHQHDRRSAISETKGLIGSRLMNERKKEKSALMDEFGRLQAIAQPSLLN